MTIFRALFPCGDDMVCIIDDREDVWQGCRNLVQVKPYFFFQHSANIHAPPGMNKVDDPRKAETYGCGESPEENEDDKNGVTEEIDQDEDDDVVNDEEKSPEDKESATTVGSKEVELMELENSPEQISKVSNETTEIEAKQIIKETENKINKSETNQVSKEAEMKVNETETKINETETKISETETKVSETETKVSKIKTKVSETETKVSETETKVSETENKTNQVDSESKTNETTVDEATNKAVNETEKLSLMEQEEKYVKEKTLKEEAESNVEVECEDQDDYLLYLEDILRRIHTEYYTDLEDEKGRRSLCDVILKVRAKVLQGLILTFSGIIPIHQKLHQSRAYKVAQAFGAQVTQVNKNNRVLFS